MLWRIAAAVGGLGGLGSLLLPYAHVSSNVAGLGFAEGPSTLFEMATLLEDTGNDPAMLYVLAGAIIFGSVVTLVGAVAFHHLAGAGGVVQAGAAGLFWYGIQLEGAQTFVMGLARVDASVAVGFYVLVAAAAVSLLAAVAGALTAPSPETDRTTRSQA